MAYASTTTTTIIVVVVVVAVSHNKNNNNNNNNISNVITAYMQYKSCFSRKNVYLFLLAVAIMI